MQSHVASRQSDATLPGEWIKKTWPQIVENSVVAGSSTLGRRGRNESAVGPARAPLERLVLYRGQKLGGKGETATRPGRGRIQTINSTEMSSAVVFSVGCVPRGGASSLAQKGAPVRHNATLGQTNGEGEDGGSTKHAACGVERRQRVRQGCVRGVGRRRGGVLGQYIPRLNAASGPSTVLGNPGLASSASGAASARVGLDRLWLQVCPVLALSWRPRATGFWRAYFWLLICRLVQDWFVPLLAPGFAGCNMDKLQSSAARPPDHQHRLDDREHPPENTGGEERQVPSRCLATAAVVAWSRGV